MRAHAVILITCELLLPGLILQHLDDLRGYRILFFLGKHC